MPPASSVQVKVSTRDRQIIGRSTPRGQCSSTASSFAAPNITSRKRNHNSTPSQARAQPSQHAFFKTLVEHEITVELKNEVQIRGTLKSVDQYLNIKLDNAEAVDEVRWPHLGQPDWTGKMRGLHGIAIPATVDWAKCRNDAFWKLERLVELLHRAAGDRCSTKDMFIRGSVVRYVHLPSGAVDTALLEDATRREIEATKSKAK
ncbi:hypothetical protein OPT61_g7732 [Boeremia exigua]|uniref:Uncharacterized protein n=1 Tax=Boeremia exigua TaxID=749465 RepID=A0ACC2I1Q3_9PLEO|nr:hypothetical protein OPT61_g7732 [Boeremia exigua]